MQLNFNTAIPTLTEYPVFAATNLISFDGCNQYKFFVASKLMS